MKTNNYMSGGVIAAILTLFSSGVFALGLGVTSGSGTEEWTDTSDSTYYNIYNDDGDRKISNFGFVLDTNVARDRTFNYRFSLMTEDNDADGTGLNMSGISMTHDWGFALFRNRNVRLWMGPRLRIAVYDEFEQNGWTADDGGLLTFGLGPVIGINVHLPKVVTFSLTAAYLSGFYSGDYDLTPSYGSTINEDVEVDSDGVYLNASLIFRIRDEY